MDQFAFTKGVASRVPQQWRSSVLSSQQAGARNLTIGSHGPRRSTPDLEEPKEKEREVAFMSKATGASWLRPTSDFIPVPELGRPVGGSSPALHFFREKDTDVLWIGKLGQVPLREKEVIEAARRLPGFLGVYADEILEKLGLAVYQMLGIEVPESALSYQQITLEGMHSDMLLAMQLDAEDTGSVFKLSNSPRMHYMARFIENFCSLDKDFVENYIIKAKCCGNEYVKISTQKGELLPLRGLGRMLAAADFVYDLDCLGDSCGNAVYVIRIDETGERYAQLVKIDAGYAFSYSELRTDQTHNPRDRQIRIAPNQLRLQFADLAPIDQQEFAATAQQILATPYEEFACLFSKTEEIEEGIASHHWQQLLDELIARKGLFLKAFAPETDRRIFNEIETAQAKVAKKLESREEASSEAVEKLLAQEREESRALAELRIRLAVVDVEHSESEKIGECKTFQLPKATAHFVGRKEMLAEVAKQLGREHGTVIGQSISGIGGVGKTQLALHYANAAICGQQIGGVDLAYEHVIWLHAETFLEGQFQALAEVFLGQQLEAAKVVPAVYEYLKNKHCLLVFDNAENARSIEAFLPPPRYSGSLHLLITSRSSRWGGIPTIKLSGFSLEEAQEYVEYHLGPQPKEAVAKLAELLEGLPLAMSQSVSYIKAGHCTLEAFEKQFYLNQANLMSHELLIEESHPKTVGTTLTLALAQAKTQSSLAEKLLGVAAYLAPERIQSGLLTFALDSTIEEVKKAIDVLESYSLITREVDSRSIQIHRLVQEVIRHRHTFLSDRCEYWNKAVKALNNVMVANDTDLKAMRIVSPGIVHTQQLAKLYKHQKLDPEQERSFCSLLAVCGNHQQLVGNFEVAKEFQEQALEILQSNYGSDSTLASEVLVNLGNAYGSLGNRIKHKECLEQALAIIERNEGNDYEHLGVILSNLGETYHAIGDSISAKYVLERALAIQEQRYGRDHPKIATILGNLANVYGALGDAHKKKQLLEIALGLFKRHYGEEHPHFAQTLMNLGNAYGTLGDFEAQKSLLIYSAVLKGKHYGPEHLEVYLTLFNLAAACYASEDYVDAYKHAKNTYVKFNQTLGESHPLTKRAENLLMQCEVHLQGHQPSTEGEKPSRIRKPAPITRSGSCIIS